MWTQLVLLTESEYRVHSYRLNEVTFLCVCVTGVSDIAIVERGRNVVSSSRDGTARLWDCGKSACLTKYAADSVINACSLHVPDASIDLLQPDHVPGIVLTVDGDSVSFPFWAACVGSEAV